MRRFRIRQPVERLTRDTRRGAARWTRWVYLAVLLAAAIWAFDTAFGHLLYVRADGLVVAKATAIASEYTARVETVSVSRGNVVEAGQQVARLSSQEFEQQIASVKLRISENRKDLAELRGELETTRQMLPSAQERYQAAQERSDAFTKLRNKGLLTAVQIAAANNDSYQAQSDLQTLTTDLVSLQERIVEIERTIATAEELLASMHEGYDSGNLMAPVAGLVGDVLVTEGDVVPAGGTLIELYSEPRYVIAFLPTGTLYTLAPDDPVMVEYGGSSHPGRITSIESVSPALPKEFQKAFLPTQRQQLAYISLDRPDLAPPLFATIRLSAAGFPPAWVGRLFDTDPPANAPLPTPLGGVPPPG